MRRQHPDADSRAGGSLADRGLSMELENIVANTVLLKAREGKRRGRGAESAARGLGPRGCGMPAASRSRRGGSESCSETPRGSCPGSQRVRTRAAPAAGLKMLKYPRVSSSDPTDRAISAAVERSLGGAFFQAETCKRANKIAFRVGPGWLVLRVRMVCGWWEGVLELAEAKSACAG